MRDEKNISSQFQWSQAYFLSVAEVVLALLDSEEDSLRRTPPPSWVCGSECAFLTLDELGAYHRQLFLWGWRFWLPMNVLLEGPEGSP